MDYYNMMYGRVRHEELIAEAQRENRSVAEARATSVAFFARIAAAARRIFRTREAVQRPSSASRRLAAE